MSASNSQSNPPPTGPSSPRQESTGLGDTELQKVHAQLMREKSEPSEGYAPLPLVIVFLFAALSFWAGIYIVKYSGGFSPMHYDETKQFSATADASPKVYDPVVAGKRFFTKNCVVCHQATGLGVPGAFPPVNGSDWVHGADERLIKILLHGMNGEVHVNGKPYNGNMPSFVASKDKDIAAVLTYLRTSPEMNNNAAPITEEQVKSIRTQFPRTTPWSGPELEALYGTK
ncbi:MAG: cytochrome c [Verrucomicrobiota bacterium]|nr:cytochrome c [Verrucomicrobiota bacterium]